MSKVKSCLWFDGQAEDAARLYTSLLPNSRIDAVCYHVSEKPGGTPGDILSVDFTLSGVQYIGLNGGPKYKHSPAFSISVACDNQIELDRIWNVLVEDGTPMRCGWLTDRFGVSWQIVPKVLIKILQDGNSPRAARVVNEVMKMQKIEIDALLAAFKN